MGAVNPEAYSRFDERMVVFSRVWWDRSFPYFGQGIGDRARDIIKSRRRPGYSREIFNLYSAAWVVHDTYEEAYEERKAKGLMRTVEDLRQAVIEGAAQRVRPKIMTVLAIGLGLVPIMWSHETGADVMKRIAAPMIGGMITSTLITLLVIPVIYFWWKGRKLEKNG